MEHRQTDELNQPLLEFDEDFCKEEMSEKLAEDLAGFVWLSESISNLQSQISEKTSVSECAFENEEIKETPCETVKNAETVETECIDETIIEPEKIEETTCETVENAETVEEVVDEIVEEEGFKLTPPQNQDEIFEKICTKRGRKLIYVPKEVIFEGEYVVNLCELNEEGIPAKDIYDAIIKEGLKKGFLDKFDGLKTPEIKEEYAGETLYEIAEQELRKMGVVYEDGVFKVYVYNWDLKNCYHIGFLDSEKAEAASKYFMEKEQYSFDLCGIITGGKAKHVMLLENGKIKIKNDKGNPLGIELDVTVTMRKD